MHLSLLWNRSQSPHYQISCLLTIEWRENSPMASPMSPASCVGKFLVCASTYVPSSSRKQTPIPVRFHSEEKAATLLYLKQPCCGFCHTHAVAYANCPCISAREPCAAEEWFEGAFVDTQPSIRFWALETTWAAVSFSLFHSLLLRCFHKLHKTPANLCCTSFCSV